VPTGELPRNILLSVDRRLVQTIVPEMRLTVVGIYSVYQASAKYVQPTLSVSFVILVDKHILKMLICSFTARRVLWELNNLTLELWNWSKPDDYSYNSNFRLDEVGCFPMFSLMNGISFYQ
jgi:hypothetical protein